MNFKSLILKTDLNSHPIEGCLKNLDLLAGIFHTVIDKVPPTPKSEHPLHLFQANMNYEFKIPDIEPDFTG